MRKFLTNDEKGIILKSAIANEAGGDKSKRTGDVNV